MILYVKKYCPFCQKVIAFIDDNSLGEKFEYRDIADDTIAQELIAHGGKRMVPYLIDQERDVAMYESDDIVAYLQEHYVA